MSSIVFQSESKIQSLNLAAQVTSNVYAQSILTIAVAIIRCARESKDNAEERLRISERIFEISMACSYALTKLSNDSQTRLSTATKDLIDSLQKIHSAIEKINSRKKLMQVLSRSSDASFLKASMEELDHRVRLFEIRIQISNGSALHSLSEEAKSEFRARLKESISSAQAEQLTLIREKVGSQVHDALAEMPSIPPKPQVFLGRDSEIEQIVERLSTAPQSFVAILGPGGIGKTSLIVAAMHHRRTIDIFGRYRFYIPCDSLKDASSLIAAIASLFKLESARPLAQLKMMLESSGLRIMLTLDNFETPWEALAGRVAVEDVLAKLASISLLSLAVTLRGAERPGQISWTRPIIPQLQPLEHASAKEVFLVISDVDPCPEVDELIASVDYVPLAITLMASLAQFTPCDVVLSNWEQWKTAMLTRGIAGRLSNVDVSIEMSLTSPRLESQPHALELLQVLSVLPDGVIVSEVAQMAPPSLKDVEVSLLPTLLQVSLVYLNTHDNKIRVLAPVREYVHSRHSIPLENLSHLLVHYAGHVKKAYLCRGSSNSVPLADALLPQFGNIYSTISLSLPEQGLAELAAQAAVHCAAFPPFRIVQQALVGMLDSAVKVAESLQLLKLQVDCLMWLETHSHQSDAQKEELLDHTAALCSTLGDQKRDVVLLLRYSQLHTKRGSPLNAYRYLREAQSLCSAATPFWLRLTVLVWESRAYHALGNLDKAVATCNQALLLLQNGRELLHSTSKAHFHRIRAMCNMDRSLFSIASADFEHCMESSQSSLSRTTAMGDYADALYMQSRLRSAKAGYESALAVRAGYGERDHVASLQVYLADIALLQGRVEDAWHLYSISLSTFQALEMPTEIVRPVIGLGDIELRSDRPVSAFEQYSQADFLIRERGFVTYSVYLGCVLRQGDAQLMGRHSESALRYYIVACAWSCRRSNRLGVAQGLQRIGDLLFIRMTPDSVSEASSCYEVTLELIRFLGANRHIADCLYRLGMVCLWRGDMLIGRKRFTQAKRFYVEAESPEGEALCEERLLDCDLSRDQILDDFPSMPLANLLIY